MNTNHQSPKRRGLRWWVGCGATVILILGVVFTVATLVAGALAKSELEKSSRAPGRLVDVGGYTMHIHCLGSGSPTVVMEAGNNDFSVQWYLLEPQIAEFTRVCVYDRAGLGWSDPSPRPRTIQVMIDELHTLLKNANVPGPYVLVGHSFGGIILRAFARAYPAQAIGIVLVDSAHEEQFARVPALRRVADHAVAQFRSLATMSNIGLLAMSPEQIPDRGLQGIALSQYRGVLATTRYFDGATAETEAIVANFANPPRITGLDNLPLVVISRGLAEPLPGVSASDNQQYEESWQAMQAELVRLSSNSRQVIAKQSGHYIQLAEPQLVINAIRQMVAEIRHR